ncbi:hypothetical protein T552_01279 [Pneumocystis carinii B80]|uniref:cystathionine gamma-lyase n=1 Tax=Pneumocystis carinii (strain B80) TaxID=1408658 RepID=A0A0W4ZLS5_PNEC8|nr:hypothetical protein T552_01279 [Pneumocystis carinii B80]KTW29324.1 hypothetical protein T552_01279 [Pneumocystis carinii B80]
MNNNRLGFGTLAIHSGIGKDPQTGALISPIHLSTTFAQLSPGNPVSKYDYSRSGNPSRESFEEAIRTLENAKYSLAFSSGLAALMNIFHILSPGSHAISSMDVYGGTHRYFTRVVSTYNIQVTFVDLKDEKSLIPNIRPETKLLWIETPSNPTLSVVDICSISKLAHEHNIIVVIDNTFVSPYLCNPLDHGADIVVHSATKYINGHSDVVLGVIALNCDNLYTKFKFLQNAIGAVPSPFDCWLAQRGLKTLHLRYKQCCINALAIAKTLEKHELVIQVFYPGLESYPQRKIVEKQHRNGLGGGMLSFRIKGGSTAAKEFCQSTKLFCLAESLGAIESLCEIPALMTHSGISKEEREKIGIYDDLIRLSVGCEEEEDLVNDILQALKKCSI